jgi:hypothetical protein
MGQYLPRLMQEYSTSGGGGGGAGGPGNALQSAYQAIIGGKMTKVAGDEFDAMGLAHSEHIKGSMGAHITGMKGSELFMSNPYQWVQQILMPALAQHGITESFAVNQEITKMFSNRTAADVIGKMALQGRYLQGENSPFEKDARLARDAKGIGSSFDELMSGDWQTNVKAFHKQFENLLELFGNPIVKTATEMLRGINDMMSGMAQWAGQHPDAIRIAMEAAAIIGGSLVVGGILAVCGAIASLAPVAAGIGAAATAIGAFAALNWDSLIGWINSIAAALRGFAGGAANPPGWQPGAAPPGVHHGPGGAFKKESFNAIPPGGGGAGPPLVHTTLYVDNRVLAEATMRGIADRSTRPLEGSAHFDSTWSSPASDVSYA